MKTKGSEAGRVVVKGRRTVGGVVLTVVLQVLEDGGEVGDAPEGEEVPADHPAEGPRLAPRHLNKQTNTHTLLV